jgi:uncharacterized protein YndB with AHSA1/START domain
MTAILAEEEMTMDASRKPDQSDGDGLSAERMIEGTTEVIFDAFIALYDSQRPDWVTGSQLDLRPGGHWSVEFQVPEGPAFREDRILTAVERPHHLGYDMRVVQDDVPGFSTHVEVTIEAGPGGHRIRLVQEGLPARESRDDFAGAWPDVLAELDRRVSGSAGR